MDRKNSSGFVFIILSFVFLTSCLSATVDGTFYEKTFPELKSDHRLVTSGSQSFQLFREPDVDFVAIAALSYDYYPLNSELEHFIRQYDSLSSDKKFAAVDFRFLLVSENENRAQLKQIEEKFNLKNEILVDSTLIAAADLNLTATYDVVVLHKNTRRIVGRLNFKKTKDRKKLLGQIVSQHSSRVALNQDVFLSNGLADVSKNPLLSNKFKFSELDFGDHIAPILIAKCVSCHNDQGSAPWSMKNYESIRRWKSMIREVILTKRMPPSQSDSYYAAYSNEKKLTREEIRKIVKWLDDGAPPPRGKDPLRSYKLPPAQEFPLGKPDLIIQLPDQKVDADGVDVINRIKMDWPLDKPVRIRGMDVQTSTPQATHHLSVYFLIPTSDPNNPTVVMFDSGYVQGYAPTMIPFGASYVVPAKSPIRISPHLQSTGKEETVKLRIAYYYDKSKNPVELTYCGSNTRKIDIPPYAQNHTITTSVKTLEDMRVIQVGAHMHDRGKSVYYSATLPDGSKKVLLSVPYFDRKWQREYLMQEPMFIPKGSVLNCRGIYDNSSKNPRVRTPHKRVNYGWLADDEMLTCSCSAIREVEYQKIKPDKKTKEASSLSDSNRVLVEPLNE